MRFEYEFQSANPVYFAYCFPYSYATLQAKLAALDARLAGRAALTGIAYTRSLLGRSLEGRRLDLISITAAEGEEGADTPVRSGSQKQKWAPMQLDDGARSPADVATRRKSSSSASSNSADGNGDGDDDLLVSGQDGAHAASAGSDAGGAGARMHLLDDACEGAGMCFDVPLDSVLANHPPDRRICFVSARVHPGETQSSFVLSGMLDFLLSDDPRALVARRHTVFHIVPMLNPDGVARGHYRVDTRGVNLNRVYNFATLDDFPTIAATRDWLGRLQADGLLQLYLDLHGHASRKGCFIFGNWLEERASMVANVVYPMLIAANSPHFDFDQCDFSEQNMHSIAARDNGLSKEGSGRVDVHRMTGLAHVYTLECNYWSGHKANAVAPATGTALSGRISPPCPQRSAAPYTVETFRQVGRACVVALLDLLDCNPHSRLPNSSYGSRDGLFAAAAAFVDRARAAAAHQATAAAAVAAVATPSARPESGAGSSASASSISLSAAASTSNSQSVIIPIAAGSAAAEQASQISRSAPGRSQRDGLVAAATGADDAQAGAKPRKAAAAKKNVGTWMRAGAIDKKSAMGVGYLLHYREAPAESKAAATAAKSRFQAFKAELRAGQQAQPPGSMSQ